jgi:predicted DNA-binding transcriptional regulator YafY
MSPTLSFDQICRRASGRRRYNLQRQMSAMDRRKEVAKLLTLYGRRARGVQLRIARELGVSESTISRDIRHIRSAIIDKRLTQS